MNDSTDGSSMAAHRAQLVKHSSPSSQTPPPQAAAGGFFQRIIGALSPSDTGEEAQNDLPSQAGTLAHGLINLRRMAVEDVAIPKPDIVAVPITITKSELVQVFRDSGLTRIPVYRDTLDTPIGMAHLKDFALQYGFNGKGGTFSLKEMLRPLLFVPPSMPIGILLSKMQTERRHLALVIDEYGGVDGLVTIENLIEQVVGEIEDEHDIDEGALWQREDSGNYLAQAKTSLEDFEVEIGFSLTDSEDIDEEEIDTLGGLVFMLSGRVPVRGEVIKHPSGVEFEVLEADLRRVKRLRVCLPVASEAQSKTQRKAQSKVQNAAQSAAKSGA